LKNRPVSEVRHGWTVWTNTFMDDLRRAECLCLNCGKMMDCDIAQRLYEECCEQGIALAVTRCPDWEDKEC
jgi:hypothetical protein